MTDNIAADVAVVARIAVVPTILEVVCRTTGMRFAAVARVTEDRWIACAVRDEIQFGLQPGSELDVATTICQEIRVSEQPVVIDHVAEDEAFCGHPTPALYGFQSYISVPIVRPGGGFFGTLCAFDPRPARLNRPQTIGMFRLFADLIGFHLNAQERLETSEAALLQERQRAELREQFIAVLGHDLRNPLAAIEAGTRALQREQLSDQATTVVQLMQSSVARMARLIDNVLDFARGRLGGGLELDRNTAAPLEPVLEQVVAELRAAWPGRVIETQFDLPGAVRRDRNRMAQLASNLLANALMHGAPNGPIQARASTDGQMLELSVANPGEPIPPAMLERLFQPFSRASARQGQQGLGLGLYIAAEIARAHDGVLSVTSTSAETRFTLRMPLR